MSLAAKLLSASGGVDKLYVDDVFSTYLYTGNGSGQTINNGIDLAGKGGMVWIKDRNDTNKSHVIQDTLRGVGTNTKLSSATTTGNTSGGQISTFNSNGFTTNGADTGQTFVSWTFRKSSKFFDVVTYTGNGVSGRQIAHSLGVAPGLIIVKRTDGSGQDWVVYHVGIDRPDPTAIGGGLALNSTAAASGINLKALFGNNTQSIPPTASVFTVTGGESVNFSGYTYVAYLFAHDPSADGIIQCGSFTTDGSGNATVTLGWEPQFILTKASSTTGDWALHDVMRGAPVGGLAKQLYANSSEAEGANANYFEPRADGFRFERSPGIQTRIYLAIRRPNKPPTTGTEVYNAIARTGTGAAATVTGVGFAPDLVISKSKNCNLASAGNATPVDRLRGASQLLQIANTNSEKTDSSHISAFGMDGISVGGDSFYISINYTNENYINHFFKRAPGVFDVVCYTGTGVAKTEAHNLGVAPELMIVKCRNAGYGWLTYAQPIGAVNVLLLNATMTSASYPSGFNSTSPTASVFSVGTVVDSNESAGTYVAYLFATLPGISKVGSYTGNGTSQTINCGFTTGARFILIKRTDSTGDWYIWDTARGIVSANDPHLSLNTTAVEVTTDDSVNPDVSGFIVNQVAATNINVSGGQYIFLSIA